MTWALQWQAQGIIGWHDTQMVHPFMHPPLQPLG
jgi:hypothetical protein